MDRFLIKKPAATQKPQKSSSTANASKPTIPTQSLSDLFSKPRNSSTSNTTADKTTLNPFAVKKRALQQRQTLPAHDKPPKTIKKASQASIKNAFADPLCVLFPLSSSVVGEAKENSHIVNFEDTEDEEEDKVRIVEDTEEDRPHDIGSVSSVLPAATRETDDKSLVSTLEQHATPITVDGSLVQRVKQASMNSFLDLQIPEAPQPEDLTPEERMALVTARYALHQPHRVLHQASHHTYRASQIDANIYSRLHVSSVQFPAPYQLAPRVGVTTIVFDREGELVAVGASNGCIRVYDFNEIIFRTTRMSEALSSPHLLPVVSVMTGKDISVLVWLSDSLLAVAHRYSSTVNVFDLEAYVSSPSHSPVMQIQTACNGNTALCYVSEKNLLVVGSTTGILSGYHMGTTTTSTRFSVKADCQTHEGAHTAIVSVLQVGHNPSLLAVAMYSGVVCVYNCDKMATQSFSRQMRPECVYRVSVPESGIIGMSTEPSSFRKLALTSRFGNVYAVEIMDTTAEVERLIKCRDIEACEEDQGHLDETTSTPQVTCAATYMHSAKTNVLMTTERCLVMQPGILQAWLSDEPIAKPLFAPAAGMTFTVPGYIVNASPGSAVVDVSCDLKEYLCSKLTTSAGCCVNNYRSHMIKLCVGTATTSGTVYLIEKINPRSLVFDTAYSGPLVCNGEPRVYIRTNIAPTSGGSRSKLRVLSEVKCDTRITAVASHPSAPYAMIGLWDDSLRVVSC